MLSRLLWTVAVVPLWYILGGLPSAAVVGRGDTTRALVGLLGYTLATVVVLVVQRRRFAGGRVGWRVPVDEPEIAVTSLTALAAFVAGIGVLVLASEAGNVGFYFSDMPVKPQPAETLVGMARLYGIALGLLVIPLGTLMVLLGAMQRTLHTILRPRTTMALVLLFWALVAGPVGMAQSLLLFGLPVWIFRRSGHLGLAVLAHLPSVLIGLLVVFGLGPGVAGFDVVDTHRVLWQPIWFDVLGAVLLGLGVAPLVHVVFPREDVASR